MGLTARLRAEVGVPVAAANRINTAELAEEILAMGQADLIALARPLLADPDFEGKARAGQSGRIAPCIACNQACTDPSLQANSPPVWSIRRRVGRRSFRPFPPCRAALRLWAGGLRRW